MARNQKKAIAEGRRVVFVDQSGFYLLPGLVRTYAPVGQTSVIPAPLSRDHLSAMGGITPEGKLYLMVQERAYRGADVVVPSSTWRGILLGSCWCCGTGLPFIVVRR